MAVSRKSFVLAVIALALIAAVIALPTVQTYAQTQIPFVDVVTESTTFSNGFGNYIAAGLIMGFGLLIVRRLIGRRG
jgi:hypothetical protein